MQNRLTFPLVIVSVVAAIAFAAQWIQERQRVYELTIATGGKDGEYYAFAQALAQVVEDHHPDIEITVLETEGSQQNMSLLGEQQVSMAIVQNDTPVRPPVRAIAYLFPEVFHVIATESSGIQSVSDLRGKRVALMPKGSGSYALFQPLKQHYGLTDQDFTPVILPPQAAYDALRRGEVDALFRVIALGSTSVGELLRTTDTRLIPIDQAESLQLNLPYLEATQIPKGTYDGAKPMPPEDLSVVGVRALLLTHEGISPEVVQRITQTLFEFRSELVAIYPRAAMVRLPDSSENLGLPFHPGAKAYYDQDEPNFLVAYSEVMGLLLSVSILLVSGFWQFRSWLNNRQKNRADMYNLEIVDLINRVSSLDDLAELETLRKQLFTIFCKVVTDLDQDRISPESFQSFTFPWEVALNTIRHREMVLMNLALRQSHKPEDLPDEQVKDRNKFKLPNP